ncbi:glycosyltransferase family 4 protein [Telmatobacter bradus]|uniref:glycosyltransferase family 4 protein n=1 Tax=Telmatobacter bradus TaxID=474953 RepID=UPI003B43476E
MERNLLKPVLVVGVTSAQSCLILRGRLSALREAGFQVTVVSAPGALLDSTAEAEGVQAMAIPMQRGIALLADLVSFYRLWRLLGRLRPDLVEFSTPKAGLLGTLAARLRRVPLRIYLLRGLRLETTYGLRRLLLLAMERLAAAGANIVLCNSQSLKTRAEALRLAPEGKLQLLGGGSSNGVDMERYAPGESQLRRQLGFGAGQPVIGFVGRLTCDKGVPELIAAFDLILRREPQAWLLLVGWFDESEDALPLPLRKKILTHPRILLTGMVTSAAEYYRAMDMLVLPTWREGFPNVVLEASATGIPVVTTVSTGSRDSVVPEVTGLLIPPGYPVAICEAVLTLLKDPERRRAMGQAARAWTLAHYAEEDVLGRTAAFYRKLSEQKAQEQLAEMS